MHTLSCNCPSGGLKATVPLGSALRCNADGYELRLGAAVAALYADRLMLAFVDLQDICVGATGAGQMPSSGWQKLCVSWVVWTPMCA